MAADHLAAPMPLEEHRKLAAFAGEWNGEEVVYPSRWNAGGPATSHVMAANSHCRAKNSSISMSKKSGST